MKFDSRSPMMELEGAVCAIPPEHNPKGGGGIPPTKLFIAKSRP
jgi:hypothetical protein